MRTSRSQRCHFARPWQSAAAGAVGAATLVVAMLAVAGCGAVDVEGRAESAGNPDLKSPGPGGTEPKQALAQGAPGSMAVMQPSASAEQSQPQPVGQSSLAGAGVDGASALPPEHRLLHAGFDPQSPCTCATAALEHRWCWRCNVGYVAGERIESAALFEGLDPHGHELDNESLQLRACRDAIESDGYCEAVGLGFVAGKAYFTQLTWGLARGVAMDRTALTCETCRALPEEAAQPRWCEKCGRGFVGNTALTDRDMFDRTAREYGLLLAAIEKSSTCGFCAVAIVAHLTCPTCQISYESGELSAASLRPGAALKERSEPEGS